jgi:hypothetical protein
MPDHFTTRLQLPYPDLDDPADVPVDMQQLADRLDLLIPSSSAGGLVLNRASVLDVGMSGQVRAGRQLALADFTALGLAAPTGLWNLSDLTDASGNARALVNKGAVTFAPGINGTAATASQFTGSAAQALYIADTGVNDPFRIRTGSWGCWFRTAKRLTEQVILSKTLNTGNQRSWYLEIGPTNVAAVVVSLDGVTPQVVSGVSDVCDDRWHFGVASFDGTTVRVYVDGVLETTAAIAGTLFGGTAPLNIGGASADAATAAGAPHFGRVDEAFVTADVLTDDQVRNLYCARLLHGYGVVPGGVRVNVTRRRRGVAWAVADFPVQPLRLHNFTGVAPGFYADEGSNGQVLVWQGGTTFDACAGADGRAGTGATVTASSFAATDAGLPAGLTARTYGCWLKSTSLVNAGLMGWGTNDVRLLNDGAGRIQSFSGADQINGPFYADGQWHHVVVVEDNAAADGVRRKLYMDGRLVSGSTVMNNITLAGANRFRVGANPDGTLPTSGQFDGVFVSAAALTTAQVLALWAKGSQSLSPSPKNAGDHVEAWDAAAVYATFDTLDSNAQVDLGVSA